MTGRSRMLLGARYVINLNSKGGVRKSPGTNSHAVCVGAALAGKKHDSRAAVKKAFTAASKACIGK